LPAQAGHSAPSVHGAYCVTPSKGDYALRGMSLWSDGRAESEDTTLTGHNALISIIEYIANAYSFTRASLLPC
jgi:formamidase